MDTKRLRQKIVEHAMNGTLVPPNNAPASELLERIHPKAHSSRGVVAYRKVEAIPFSGIPFFPLRTMLLQYEASLIIGFEFAEQLLSIGSRTISIEGIHNRIVQGVSITQI